ncbi:hypothetical protein ACFS6H_02780 [Terrimonas rubra]|uniref:TLP18.3, Psb32 and MOLO-1 founding protein of phosphatase n=1 Tax=Terrimonas rubra TaxID=1035890 RepID=A0ABW6A2X7_9BACT
MFKVFFIAVSCLTIMSCNNNSPQPTVNNNPSKDSATAPEKPKDTIAGLKDLTINEAYYEQKVKKAKKLADSTITSLSLTDIEDINRNNDAAVKIIDTLWHTDTEQIIIVALDGETEMSAYLVHVKNNRLKQFEQVYYADVVEYFMQVNSTIKDNRLSIVTTTDADGSTTKKATNFLFKDGSLQKIN